MEVLDRMTEKARLLVAEISAIEHPVVGDVLDAISRSEGVGKYLYELYKKARYKKSEPVDLDKLVQDAYVQAHKLKHPYVGTEHIFLVLLETFDKRRFEKALVEMQKVSIFPSVEKSAELNFSPFLSTFGEDFNKKVLLNSNRKLIERKEYKELVSSLLLREYSSVLLVGDPGVGKRSIVELLAQHINNLDVPTSLAGYKLIALDILAFMTTVVNKIGADVGINSLISEIKSIRRVILYLENFEDLFFSTSAGLTVPLFFSMLSTRLSQEGILAVATMSDEIYQRIDEENSHIIENFAIVEIPEPEDSVAQEILRANAVQLSAYHNVEISADLISYAFDKAKSLKSGYMPKKAIELLDNACTKILFRKGGLPQDYKDMIDKSVNYTLEIEQLISKGDFDKALQLRNKMKELDEKMSKSENTIFVNKTALRLTKKDVDSAVDYIASRFSMDESQESISKYIKLAERLKKKIIGQDKAIDVVSKALIRGKLGLRSKKRPIGNFLFLGPTGVGKTELAKLIAKEAFANRDNPGIIRLDMSDFAEKHNVARLVGAPPGYVGYGEGGELTNKIDDHPQSVVLFDEIEKAHPDVLNILLQIMEEGELSDAKGNKFDFSKSILILTSNLGTEILHNQSIGFSEQEMTDANVEKRLMLNLKKILKPELLNRFDEIVVFKRLNKSDQKQVLNVLVKEVTDNLKQKNVRLVVDQKALDYLLEKGFSKEYGARELRRVLEKELLDKIAEVLLLEEKDQQKEKEKIRSKQKNKNPTQKPPKKSVMKLTATVGKRTLLITRR